MLTLKNCPLTLDPATTVYWLCISKVAKYVSVCVYIFILWVEGPSTFQKRERRAHLFFVSIRRPSVDFDLKRGRKKKVRPGSKELADQWPWDLDEKSRWEKRGEPLMCRGNHWRWIVGGWMGRDMENGGESVVRWLSQCFPFRRPINGRSSWLRTTTSKQLAANGKKKTGKPEEKRDTRAPHQQNLTEEKKRKFFSSIFLCVSVFYCFPPFSFLLVFRLFLVRPTFI